MKINPVGRKFRIVHSSYTLWVENFDEIALSRTVKETEAILCFSIFGENSKIQNGRHFWGGEDFLKINNSTFLLYPVFPFLGENFDEIALSRTVKEIQAILCFSIFGENSKIQNGRHFCGGENFLKINNSTFLLYPAGRKFRRNCLRRGKFYLACTFLFFPSRMFFHFWRKFKMAAIFGEGKIF